MPGPPSIPSSSPLLESVRLSAGSNELGAEISSLVKECQRHITEAEHLTDAEKLLAKELLETLEKKGFVKVFDNDPQRKAAVGGIQRAMELALRGTLIIVTELFCTPLRTRGEGQPKEQAARGDGLIKRVKQGDPLCLVCCKGTEGSEAYQKEVLEIHGPSGMGLLQEHYLERDTLPAEHSGATIISPKEEGGIGFSIRAVQVGKQTHDGCIELSLGKLGLNPNSEIDKAVGGLKDFLRAENIPFELPPLLS